MTPEEFAKLIVRGEAMQLAEAVAQLDESQRRKLSKTAAELYREIYRVLQYFSGPKPQTPRLDRLRSEPGNKIDPKPSYGRWVMETMGHLALLAVGPLTQAKKARGFGKREPACLKILVDRRPPWIDEWVEHKLKAEFPDIAWDLLRALVKRGICRKPTSDGYSQLMVFELHGGWITSGNPRLSDRLMADPDLLQDEVWRLFDVATEAFSFDYEQDKYGSEDYEGWSAALIRLCQQGPIERQRLLDASLRVLSRDFKKNALTGIMRLHDRLEPTLDEIAAPAVEVRRTTG